MTTKQTVYDWSTTAASNTTVAGTNIDENCNMAGMNNAHRSIMAGAAGFSGSVLVTGTADALVLTLAPLPDALVDGMEVKFRAAAANATTTPTLQVALSGGAGTPHTITKAGGGALLVGDIAANLAEHTARYNLANTRWELVDPAGGIISVWSTGDIKLTMKTTADSGWVMMDDGTIGSAASNATTRANADTSALFAVLWNGTSNTDLVIQDSTGANTTRGVSASADFSANKRMPLPKVLGRALGISGAGSGLTSRNLGAITGAETHAITTGEMPVHNHGITGSPAITSQGVLPTFQEGAGGGTSSPGVTTDAASSAHDYPLSGITVGAGTLGTANAGSGTAMSLMQPSSFLNIMIKL